MSWRMHMMVISAIVEPNWCHDQRHAVTWHVCCDVIMASECWRSMRTTPRART